MYWLFRTLNPAKSSPPPAPRVVYLSISTSVDGSPFSGQPPSCMKKIETAAPFRALKSQPRLQTLFFNSYTRETNTAGTTKRSERGRLACSSKFFVVGGGGGEQGGTQVYRSPTHTFCCAAKASMTKKQRKALNLASSARTLSISSSSSSAMSSGRVQSRQARCGAVAACGRR